MAKLSRRDALIGGAATAATIAILGAEGCNLATSQGTLPLGGQSNDLTVQYSNHTLGGKTLRTRTYSGQIPGPLLRVTPGTTFSVNVHNQLPPNPAATPHAMMIRTENEMGMGMGGPAVMSSAIDPMNNPHLFNTTNLHVHGLQVIPHMFEPVGTSDPSAMFVAIEPGSSYHYDFVVPADQPCGLYWYHSHHHGSTDVQASGGMAGPIIVSGPIDQVPEIAAARDIPIVIQSLQVQPDRTDPTVYSTEYVAYEPPGPPTYGYTPRSSDMFMIVNGQLIDHMTGFVATNPASGTSNPSPPPQTLMRPGEVLRLRILNGTNSLNLPLQLPGFEVYVIGIDGVNFLAPQKIDQSTGFESIAAANRIEMLVRAPATEGTYTLSALSTKETLKTWPKFDLMQFTVSGPPATMGIPAALPTPTREYPLIPDSDIAGTRTVTFDATVPAPSMLNNTALTINGVQYSDMAIMFSPTVGTAEQWTIKNNMPEGHPFHIHTNSFEVHSSTDSNGKVTTFSPPYIADTVWIPAKGSVVMRTRYKTWKGKDVFHCHKLSHEDQGMMANYMLT